VESGVEEETRRLEAGPALGDVEIWGVFRHGKALGGLIDVGGHTATEIPTRRRFRGTRAVMYAYSARTGRGRLSRDPYGRADRPAERDSAAATTTAGVALSIFRVRRHRQTRLHTHRHKQEYIRSRPPGKTPTTVAAAASPGQ